MAKKIKVRTSVSELVSSCNNEKHRSWIDGLSVGDCEYIGEVLDEAEFQCVPIAKIARALIKELGIKRSAEVVSRTLREMRK